MDQRGALLPAHHRPLRRHPLGRSGGGPADRAGAGRAHPAGPRRRMTAPARRRGAGGAARSPPPAGAGGGGAPARPFGRGAGCAYATQSLLPSNYRKIYIEPFVNRLAITQESTEIQRFATSLPPIEEDVTNEVIERFIFDGHLRVTPNRQEADLILSGELVDFHRQALRLNDQGTVEEYRLNLVANLALRDPKE